MHELTQEHGLLERMKSGFYDEGEDYDVDVYLWYPSSRPTIVVPAGLDTGAEVPSVFQREADDGLDDASSHWLPLSPTYSMVSDFEFPGKREMDRAGYSRFFSSGLVSTSRRVTRRLDGLLRSIRRRVHKVIQSMTG